MAELSDRLLALEQRFTNLETDIRIYFDLFADRLDAMRAETNLRHSELRLSLSTVQLTQATILRLLHGMDERLQRLEHPTP